jgi:hypothetical protein
MFTIFQSKSINIFMPRKQTLADFAEEIVAVPDFTPGPYGMDLVVRGDMDDREWRRWNAIAQTNDLKQMMIKHRKANGPKGLRDAVIDFLRTNNIQLKDDIEDV